MKSHQNKCEMVSTDRIEQKIYLIRRQKVMLDRDLAVLYGVETRVLNQAVTRNLRRFPKDFMFELSREEIRNMSQSVICLETLKHARMSPVTQNVPPGVTSKCTTCEDS
ncbi:MAG: ORF6N domain-containing protein [Kiritimatiellae bacterium]|nr:ORF6N domain-containing protein [Kiritimatiellia bacterium]MDD4735666.1 ORF6N domain-containing protein [Kiritimatiellia bacterium]